MFYMDFHSAEVRFFNAKMHYPFEIRHKHTNIIHQKA